VLALFVEWDETAKNFSNKETFDILGVIEAARYVCARVCGSVSNNRERSVNNVGLCACAMVEH